MSALFEPRFNINANAWNDFKTYINEAYPRDSFTHDQREFVTRCFKQDDCNCSDLNKLWINIFVDQLIDHLEGWPTGTTSERLEMIHGLTGKALLGFFNSQYALRQNVPASTRSAEQVRMLEIHPNIVNFPIMLTLDIARHLQISTTSQHAPQSAEEKVEDQKLFHELHEHVVDLHKQGVNLGVPPNTAQAEATTGKWSAHSVEDTFMRLCTYKIWCDKYEQENEWSLAKMTGQWLKEAIQLYNNVSYHWQSCKVKKFDDSQFQAIRQTASNTWASHVVNRAFAMNQKLKKPTTNWITDWCTYPVAEKRLEWETYYCNVMLHAKNMAKLLNKHERTIEEEPEPKEEEHELKRSRTEEEPAPTAEAVELPLEKRIVHDLRSDFHRLERMIVQVDRNASIRHNDTLREMLGHFNPLRNQMQQLSNGQTHAFNMLEKIHQKNP